MPRKVLILGVTGYIGGDALFATAQAHPDFEVACLVRNSDKGAQVASQYPRIRLVYGDLDDVDVLEHEAKKVDIVLNCAHADHGDAAKALMRGLASRETDRPGFYIHTSGNSLLMVADMDRQIMGEASSKIYDDWEGIGEVTSLPDHAPHRITDKIVIEADSPQVKTAIVCPPTIYGRGRGPGNQRSHQVPELVRCTLQKKQAIQLGAGENYGPNVHLHDLSGLYLKLFEAAVEDGGKATWGTEGYYFAENGEYVWGQVSKIVAKTAYKQGLLTSDEVVTISDKEANELTNRGAILWGANSRCRAIRARKLLEWSPKQRSFDDDISEVVTSEAKSLGLVTGHAAKVSG